ncbi:MAG: methyltransferase domain-containing protein [Acidimicrobiales bacterium]|nr:methyltransferase domain-containing protein [Acidimicrobiales bacterium]
MAEPTSADLRRDLVGHLREAGYLRDEGVAEAFATVPREIFLAHHVERHGLADAYRDDAIVTRRDPVTGAPTSSSSQPAIMAQMLEMLGVRRGDRVLEVGTGTGYNAALLAALVGDEGRVTSVELDADTAVAARRALVTAGAPVRVEVGDGAAGAPEAAPFDVAMATASTDRVPRPWFDQLRPGGRLVVPLRLSRVVPGLQAVVAFRKARNGFDQVAVIGGGFIPLREAPRVDAPPASPARSVALEVADARRDRLLVEVAGPALAGLDRRARQRLVVTSLGFGRSRAVPVGGAPGVALLAYVALALPEERLVEVSRAGSRSTTAREALGVVDAVDGSLALLARAPDGGLRLDAYGGPGAERAVLAAIERWRLAGRPRIADASITVRYGPVRPHGWYSARRGDHWIALDWQRAPDR